VPRCSVAVTGAPLSRRCADFVLALQQGGFEVDLIATAAAAEWFDADAVLRATGAMLRESRSDPSQPNRLPLPDVLIVCPATFNTVNKAALGIADSHAHSFVCECVASRVPTILVPMINDRLWSHPALAANLERLRSTGVGFLDVCTGGSQPTAVPSGTGESVVTAFQPAWLLAAIRTLIPLTS
jgi:phosphopantothenoylcysteine synthetase/decarboxylase